MILSSLQFQLYSTILTVLHGEKGSERETWFWSQDLFSDCKVIFCACFSQKGSFLLSAFFFFSCAPNSLQNKILISADASIPPHLYYLLPDPIGDPHFLDSPAGICCQVSVLGNDKWAGMMGPFQDWYTEKLPCAFLFYYLADWKGLLGTKRGLGLWWKGSWSLTLGHR